MADFIGLILDEIVTVEENGLISINSQIDIVVSDEELQQMENEVLECLVDDYLNSFVEAIVSSNKMASSRELRSPSKSLKASIADVTSVLEEDTEKKGTTKKDKKTGKKKRKSSAKQKPKVGSYL